ICDFSQRPERDIHGNVVWPDWFALFRAKIVFDIVPRAALRWPWAITCRLSALCRRRRYAPRLPTARFRRSIGPRPIPPRESRKAGETRLIGRNQMHAKRSRLLFRPIGMIEAMARHDLRANLGCVLMAIAFTGWAEDTPKLKEPDTPHFVA